MRMMPAVDTDEAIRDPQQAVAYGRRAVELTEARDADVLDTLAAAYAAAGDFGKARQTARAAIEAATARGRPSGEIEQHLVRYEAEEPLIDRVVPVESLPPGG